MKRYNLVEFRVLAKQSSVLSSSSINLLIDIQLLIFYLLAHYSCPSRQYSFCGRGASCAPCPAVPYSGWVRKPRFWIQQPKLCKVRNLVVVSLTVMVAGNQTVQIAALKDHQMMLVFWSKLSPNFLIFMAFWLVQVRGGQLCEWSEAWRLQLGWCQRFRPEDRVRRRPNSRIPGTLIAHSNTNFLSWIF